MRVEELIKKVKIEDIITVDVPIRMVRDKGYAVDRRGQWNSLTVYTREQTFHDFKAGQGGNVVKWLQYFHGMSYEDALRAICGKAAVDPDDLFYFQKLARETSMPAPRAKPIAHPSPAPRAKPIAHPSPAPKAPSDYPVTIAWKKWGEEKTYHDEFSLLTDCLNRAPNLVWYAKFLVFAKPAMLKSMPSESWPEFEQLTKETTTIKTEPLTPKVIKQAEMFSLAVSGMEYYE